MTVPDEVVAAGRFFAGADQEITDLGGNAWRWTDPDDGHNYAAVRVDRERFMVLWRDFCGEAVVSTIRRVAPHTYSWHTVDAGQAEMTRFRIEYGEDRWQIVLLA